MGFKVLFPAIPAGKGLRLANFSILFPSDLYTLFPSFSGDVRRGRDVDPILRDDRLERGPLLKQRASDPSG
jgi:hypothetical protein